MIEEYAYQLVGKQSEVIDKAVMAILRVKAPFTLKLAKLAQFRWVWKALGIDLVIRHTGAFYSEYEVQVRGETLGTFSLKTEILAT